MDLSRGDEKLTEAVGVYDGQGRGGGVDWNKVCEFMGPIRSYNQCRHRWHNVIKHRGNLADSEHRYNEEVAHEQWVASQGGNEHMLHSPNIQQLSSQSNYGLADKYSV